MCIVLLCLMQLLYQKQVFTVALHLRKHAHSVVCSERVKTGRKFRETESEKETQRERSRGKTADEGHWGFPLCRIRKAMRGR